MGYNPLRTDRSIWIFSFGHAGVIMLYGTFRMEHSVFSMP